MKNKEFNPGLKIIIENEFYKNKGEKSSPQVKNIIKCKKIIENGIKKSKNEKKKKKSNKNKKDIKDKKDNKEDRYIIPYKEGGDKKLIERRITFQNSSMIKDILLFYTNYSTYHIPNRITGIKDYHDRLVSMKNDENVSKKRKKECIIRTRSLKRNYNEHIKRNPNDKDILVQIETDPYYMYFIIVTLINGETYIFNPFSNMTLKNYSNKKENSYLYKLLDTESGFKRFIKLIDVMFKKNTDEFNENFTYGHFDFYKLDACNAKIIAVSGTHTVNELNNIIDDIINQMNEDSNFSETSDSDNLCSTSQEVNGSQISEIKEDNHYLKMNNVDTSLMDCSSYQSIVDKNESLDMDYCNDDSFMDCTDMSVDSTNNDSFMDYTNISINNDNNDQVNIKKIENKIITINQKQENIDTVEIYKDIYLYDEPYTNIVFNENALLVKFIDDNILIIGRYEKYPNDPFMYLKTDDIPVLRYDNENNIVEILDDKELKRQIEQEHKRIKLN